jgi:ABC-type Zn uptake system ZnuABC Zn-binding protein ZnuA
MTRRPLLLVPIAAALALLVAGCGDSAADAPAEVTAAATTSQIADLARNVGGDRVDVRQILPANTDPHDYEPTPGDAEDVAEADVVLEHGLGLDEWLDGLIGGAGGDATRVVVTSGIALLPGDEESPAGDPHVWLDPRNAVSMVRAIEAAFAAADPDGATAYRANADAYVARIEQADRRLSEQIATVPQARRVIVTDHDAFGYFARRYGIDVVGTVIPSLSTAAEPAAKDLAALVATIRREGVQAVFSEATVDPRLERAIADEAGATLGPPLYGDALGPEDGPAGTYLGMMQANMDAILAGLTA